MRPQAMETNLGAGTQEGISFLNQVILKQVLSSESDEDQAKQDAKNQIREVSIYEFHFPQFLMPGKKMYSNL